jgi:hypothetical protein
MATLATDDLATRWYVAGRVHQYDTEVRLGILRIVSIAILYAIHLFGYLATPEVSDEARDFHFYATILVVAWTLFAVVLLTALSRRVFPTWTGYSATSVDLLFLVALASLGKCANSPLVYVLFLILVAAALRFDLRLVWLTSIGCLAGYVLLLGVGDDAKWFDEQHAVEPTTQALTMASLILCGVLCGQIARRVRSLAIEVADVSRRPLDPSPSGSRVES